MEVGEQRMVHQGYHLLAGLPGSFGLVAHPVEGHIRQPPVFARVYTDNHEAWYGFTGVGQGGVLTLGSGTIAIVLIQFGKCHHVGCRHLLGYLTVIADSMPVAQVVITRNDKRMNAGGTQLVEFAYHILMTGQLAILGQVASDEHQLGLQLGLQPFYHVIEKFLALVQHLTFGFQLILPGRTIVDNQLGCHEMGVGEYDNLGLGLDCYSQGQP